MHVKSAPFSRDNSRTSRSSTFYPTSNHKYLDIPLKLEVHEHREAAIGGKSSRERFWKNISQCREILLQVK